LTEYPDVRRDERETVIRPALKDLSLKQLRELSEMSESTLIEIRAGRSRPHPKNQKLLVAIVQRLETANEACRLPLADLPGIGGLTPN
jgi:hypothetical protein